MKEDVCPFCGANRDFPDYACQLDSSGDYTRSHACKDRQIAALLERLKAWRRFWSLGMRYVDQENYRNLPCMDTLKNLKEIAS